MHAESVFVGDRDQSLDLIQRVERAELGRLGDRERDRHRMMHAMRAAQCCQQSLRRDLALFGLDHFQAHAQKTLGRGAFVIGDMGCVRAEDRAIGLLKCHQRREIGPGAVENEMAADLAAEQRVEGGLRLLRQGVAAIGHGVPAVAGDDGIHDQGMAGGEIIAGEGFGGQGNLLKTHNPLSHGMSSWRRDNFSIALNDSVVIHWCVGHAGRFGIGHDP